MECKFQVPRAINGMESGAEYLLRFQILANSVYAALVGLSQVHVGEGSEAGQVAMSFYPNLSELKMLLGQQMSIIATTEQHKVLIAQGHRVQEL